MSEKRPPTKITPNSGMVGSDNLVLLDGPNTYQIDLKALFDNVSMEALHSRYQLYCFDRDKAVRERIAETRSPTDAYNS